MEYDKAGEKYVFVILVKKPGTRSLSIFVLNSYRGWERTILKAGPFVATVKGTLDKVKSYSFARHGCFYSTDALLTTGNRKDVKGYAPKPLPEDFWNTEAITIRDNILTKFIPIDIINIPNYMAASVYQRSKEGTNAVVKIIIKPVENKNQDTDVGHNEEDAEGSHKEGEESDEDDEGDENESDEEEVDEDGAEEEDQGDEDSDEGEEEDSHGDEGGVVHDEEEDSHGDDEDSGEDGNISEEEHLSKKPRAGAQNVDRSRSEENTEEQPKAHAPSVPANPKIPTQDKAEKGDETSSPAANECDGVGSTEHGNRKSTRLKKNLHKNDIGSTAHQNPPTEFHKTSKRQITQKEAVRTRGGSRCASIEDVQKSQKNSGISDLSGSKRKAPDTTPCPGVSPNLALEIIFKEIQSATRAALHTFENDVKETHSSILHTHISQISYDGDERLRMSHQQNSEYEERIQQLTEKLQKSEDAKNEMMQTMMTVKNELLECKDKLCNSQLELNELQNNLSIAKAQIEEHKSVASKARTEHDAAKVQIAELHTQLQSVREELRKANENNEQLQVKSADLETTKEQLQVTSADLETTKEQLQKAEARLHIIQSVF